MCLELCLLNISTHSPENPQKINRKEWTVMPNRLALHLTRERHNGSSFWAPNSTNERCDVQRIMSEADINALLLFPQRSVRIARHACHWEYGTCGLMEAKKRRNDLRINISPARDKIDC